MPNVSHRFTQGNVEALTSLLDAASSRLAAKSRDRPSTAAPMLDTEYTGILFTGNPHEAVPRRLLLDNRLTPLERNAWQVFRLLLNDDGLTSFPTYEQLQPYLASSPFKVASRESVAKTLTALRLTRWLSLAGQVRDEVTGQMKGNIYLLHDDPVSLSEAILLDRNYLELLSNAQQHANKSIREVAARTLEELAQDPTMRDHVLPTRLDVLQQRLARQSWTSETHQPKVLHESELSSRTSELSQTPSELSEKCPVRNPAAPCSESEPSRKQGSSAPVRNPNSSSTCTSTNTNTDVCKSSVPRAREDQVYQYPPSFQTLPAEQRQKALHALQPLPTELRRNVLDQWAAKPEGSMRNPFGYLLRMIERARNGEFNLLSRPGLDRPTPTQVPTRTPPPTSIPETPAPCPHNPSEESRAIARQKMADIMKTARTGGIRTNRTPDRPHDPSN